MALKQEYATEDSSAVIENITQQFQAMKLQSLAKANLYLGTPLSILTTFLQALNEQRFEDEKKRFSNRLRNAGIVRERTLDAFQWDKDTYPFAEPGAIERALNTDFIKLKKNLIVAGPPGTGKSLMVIIVACKAIRDGFSVKYKTAHNIALELKEARSANNLSSYVKKMQSCDVLVIEDIIFASFDKNTAMSFFSIIDGRYGRKTTIITSNGNINEWATNLPDKRMSSALLGRFYEEAILVNMSGAEDMRLKKAKGMIDFMNSDNDNMRGKE